MREFSLPVKVYIEDTDAGGIVYHANYLKFMERSRTEYLMQLGYDKPATLENHLLLVVHSMQIDFLGAAGLSDQLQVVTKPLQVKRSYVVFEQIVNRNTQPLCRAQVKIACVHQGTMKPAGLPVAMREALLSSCQQ